MSRKNDNSVVLDIQHINQYFRDFASAREIRFNRFLTDINLKVYDKEVLGIVGESGCGKTTLGRCIVGLVTTITGKILYRGKNITHLQNRNMMDFRKNVQMIFQNPRSSLNINLTVKELIHEVVKLYNDSSELVEEKVETLVKRMKLEGRESQYPYELSGGERRRVGLARLMAVSPEVIIADEPVSNLDVSIKGFIIELLLDYQKERNATILFITHDMHLVNRICSRIVVMFRGHIIEIFKPKTYSLSDNHHPYTQKLINVAQYFANTSRHDETEESSKDMIMETQVSEGCVYYPFCSMRSKKGISKTCEKSMPNIHHAESKGQYIACHGISMLRTGVM